MRLTPPQIEIIRRTTREIFGAELRVRLFGSRLEAFVSRFGRMQATPGDNLLPRWLLAIAETPGSQIEVLNRAERLGVIENTEQWLHARKFRNRLIQEYLESPSAFAADLNLARE